MLAPLGLRQQGRSRTWFDDHGWWLIVVEFQPSSWSKGTYLNVGAMWLWREIDSFAFEYGNRLGDFTAADDLKLFRDEVRAIAQRAASRVSQLRTELATPARVARLLSPIAGDNRFRLLHAGIAAALAGSQVEAGNLLGRVHAPEPNEPEWVATLFNYASEVRALLDQQAALRERLERAVHWSRSALRLPPWTGSWSDHVLARNPDLCCRRETEYAICATAASELQHPDPYPAQRCPTWSRNLITKRFAPAAA